MKIEYDYNFFTKEYEMTIDGKVVARVDNRTIYDFMLQRQCDTEMDAFKMYMALYIYNLIEKSDKFIVEILFKHLFN